MAVEKNITWKKGKGEAIDHLSHNIEDIGKNIKWGRREEDGNLGEKIEI